ncbi:dehydrogenase/reductase SDR family protein 7-like [Amyelois transitella]|uniref:dehydrogenase/reductase SDR family protein 7-like n=1 Tax=Amyelois transitella TaxID=680683 RepID=UPI00298F9456|nr:dehydrogenase/reductase SDR family protein 7-like [Amyelois transitella]
MNPYHPSISAISWYIKYVGLPITVGVTIYSLLCHMNQRKLRAALRNKVVVITGASSGIGEALAHTFYDQGSKVVLVARRGKELNRVKDDLMSKKLSVPCQEPVVLELDLANVDQMAAFVKKVHNVCGQIDILINNGGISHRASILNTDMKVFKQIMEVNYFGTVALTKAALPNMIERKSGHIAFVSSVQGLIAIPDRAAYAASKHALQAFGDSLRAEMHQHNIVVSVISPGYIKTAISINALTGSGNNHGVMDASTAAGFSAEYAAEQFLDAIVNKKKEFILSQFMPRVAIFLRQAIPSLYFYLMTKRANKTEW